MAAVPRLSRAHSQMAVGNPTEAEDALHHGKQVKVENLSNAVLIKPEELQSLIKKMTLEDNEAILHVLDEEKAPYLFTSDDLSKMIEVTPSVRTKINIIGLVGPRLVDPKSKTSYFTGLFRYAEEKSAVEEILKARQQTLASAMFSKTDGIRNMSGRSLLGRGSPGRGGGGGRGTGPNSRVNSNTSLASNSRDGKSPAIIKNFLSEDHHDLTPTQNGFDDVLSALDDLQHKNGSSRKNGMAEKGMHMIALEEDAGRTTNDSSSIDSNDKPIARPSKSKSKSTDDDKVTLNKVDSSTSMATKTNVDPLRITIEDRSSTTARTTRDDDASSISSVESSKSRRSLTKKSLTYLGSLSSPPSSAEKKPVRDAPFQNIKTITKKYSEAAIRSSSRDEQEVSHQAIVPSSSVADRTKAIANPLLAKKAAAAAPTQPAVGKVHAIYPFQPTKTPTSPSVPTDVPKVGKLSLIYPFAQQKSTAANNNNTIAPRTPTVRHSARVATTKVTYMSSSRSLASRSSDNDSIDSTGSAGSVKSANHVPVRSATPRLDESHTAPVSSSLPILSHYNPEKAVAGGSGSFNYDLVTRCAMAVQLTKEEFLELTEKEPVRIVDGIEKHSYCELVRRNFTKNYGNLVQTDLEKYMIEEDFPLAFQKTAEQFFAQVRWRQVEQKKRALLF